MTTYASVGVASPLSATGNSGILATGINVAGGEVAFELSTLPQVARDGQIYGESGGLMYAGRVSNMLPTVAAGSIAVGYATYG